MEVNVGNAAETVGIGEVVVGGSSRMWRRGRANSCRWRPHNYVKMRRSKSERAGLLFPVARLARYLRLGNYTQRVSCGAPLFLAGVLQYLATELLELAAQAAQENGKRKISNRHIQLAIGFDEELSKLLAHAIIPSAGVLPSIHPALLLPKPRRHCPSQPNYARHPAPPPPSTGPATPPINPFHTHPTKIGTDSHDSPSPRNNPFFV